MVTEPEKPLTDYQRGHAAGMLTAERLVRRAAERRRQQTVGLVPNRDSYRLGLEDAAQLLRDARADDVLVRDPPT